VIILSRPIKTTILGRTGSGKTRYSLKHAVSTASQEILFISDELTALEFGAITSQVFEGSKISYDYPSGIIIDDYCRITFRTKRDVEANGNFVMYDTVVVDICEGFKFEYVDFARDNYIVTGQLNASEKFIILD